MTPEPLAIVPLAKALEHLCTSGLAQKLLLAIQAVRKLEAQSASSGSVDTASEVTKKREVAMAWARSELRRAGLVLADDLSYRVRRGEFHLRGRAGHSGPGAAAVVIPLEPYRSLLIDSETNSIRPPGGIYVDVEAVFGPAPSLTAVAEMPRCLPLWEAATRWCNPIILCDIRRYEGHFSQDDLRSFDHPSLGAAGDGRATLRGDAYLKAREKLEHLWQDLARDHKNRIECGEMYVQGVQMRPNLRETHEAIPSTWAADFRLKYDTGELTVAGRRYISVLCSLDPLALGPPVRGSDEHEAARTNAAPDEARQASLDESNPNQRARGRPTFAQMIEQDLLANWSAIQQRAATNLNGEPVWTELAHQMSKRMAAASRKAGHGKYPEEGTIRKNLPSIYTRLLEEKTAR